MRKIIALCLLFAILFLSLGVTSFAKPETKSEAEINASASRIQFDLGIELGGAYLCEASTGKVLYSLNEHKEASPASVTKVMTLLLVCEALDLGHISLEDSVLISAHAASMGGSQVFLEEGESITVEDLIKSTVIASGNDSSVALAELCAGSEESFVRMMNSRAKELGLKNTSFENCTGLDDTTVNHYTCAADIAAMTRELLKHPIILKYSSIWQDSIRNGEFVLTNTNRLVRYYSGCNGLKTGSTDKAGFCISATAKRENMQLIAVIMGAKTKDDRNNAARKLLDFGFANYALFEREESFVENIPVKGGVKDFASSYSGKVSICIEKSKLNSINEEYVIPEYISAPISCGQPVGRVVYKCGEDEIFSSEVFVREAVGKISFGEILSRIIKRIVCG